MTRQGFFWSVAALLGIVCAAAVAWSASLLAGQHIGLSAVPLSAAGRLAPAAVRTHERGHTGHVHNGRQAPHPAASAAQPASIPTVSAVAHAPAAGGAPAQAPASPPSATRSAPATPATPATPARPRDDSSHSGAAGSSQPPSGSSDKRDD
jgi:hypothetical protein